MNFRQYVDDKLFHTISEQAAALGVEVYAIGGFVRDIVLKRPCTDIDFVTNGKGIELAQACAKALKVGKVDIFKNFGTAHFRYNNLDLEFVGARKESYRAESRKPDVEAGTLQDDQNRRDFTIIAT
jgi:poly(A) polymerase